MTTQRVYKKEIIPEGWTKPRPPSYYVRQAEAQRKRRKENPEKYRLMGKVSERNRKLKRYGLTQQEYFILLEKQNNLCAICKNPKTQNRDWHIDHCHKTGQVRGILCHYCNLMLGQARDSIASLKEAIIYLEKSYV